VSARLSTLVPRALQERAFRALPSPVWKLARDLGTGRTGAQRRLRDARLRQLERRSAQNLQEPVVAVTYRREHLLARPVDRFEAGAVLANNAAFVADALDRDGVRYVVVDAAVQARRVVAVAASNRAAAFTALLKAGEGAPVYVRQVHPQGRHPSVLLSGLADFPAGAAACVVFQAVAARGATEALAGAELGCELEFWPELSTAVTAETAAEALPAGSWTAPRRNRWTDALPGDCPPKPRTVDGVERPTLPTGSARHVFDIDFPIDAVYTWVDGSDPAWRRRKAAASGAHGVDTATLFADNESRFASHDELRYSLRSLDMYAGWVRHVYLVTDAQVPAWLDTHNPRVTVIDHRGLFGDRGRLPTFNSHAIESQLHRIPGLADHYVYLNDDVFFGRPVGPEMFFHANGLARFFPSTGKLGLGPTGAFDRAVMSGGKNNRAAILDRFDRTLTNKFKHVPHAQRRDVLVEMEHVFGEAFERTASNQFRNPSDLSIAASLHHYFAYLTGRAVEGQMKYLYADIAEPRTEARLRRLLRSREYDVFCLNDHDNTGVDADVLQGILMDFLDQYFPLPSSFEK
jgi:hypothetical protein